MVTLVILCGAIVFIYKTFFLCVDYLSRLSGRLQANELVEEKIADLWRLYRQNQNLSFNYGPLTVTQQINHKPVDFSYDIEMVPLTGYEGLAHLKVEISWSYSGRPNHLHRAALLSL